MIDRLVASPCTLSLHVLRKNEVLLEFVLEGIALCVDRVCKSACGNEDVALRTNAVIEHFLQTVHTELVLTAGYHTEYVTSHLISVLVVSSLSKLVVRHTIDGCHGSSVAVSTCTYLLESLLSLSDVLA